MPRWPARQVSVLAFDKGTSRSAPPAPFTTSTLQQAAQAKLKYKPKETMELAQRLYEQGAITYMRTDSPNLSSVAFDQIHSYAKEKGWDAVDQQRTWKAKGGAQEAHEAIRPADIAAEQAGENEKEQALYRLIWARAVASQLADAVFATRTAELESVEDVGGEKARYQAKGRVLIEKGWQALYEDNQDEDDEDDQQANNPVPELEQGQVIDVAQGDVLTKKTKAPKRYTLATLIKALESHEIGRPATYAPILENITSRDYIAEDKKGFLSATKSAEEIIDSLVGTFDFIGLEYTSNLEKELDEIAAGEKGYATVVGQAHSQLESEIAKLGPGQVWPCPECEKPMRRRTSAHGVFWGCTGYPECKTTRPDDDGKPGEKPEQVASDHACVECKKPLRRNTRAKKDDPKKKGWDFWGCTGYPKCKKTYQVDGKGDPVFPQEAKA